MKAEGGKDIPDEEKLYFRVILPLESKFKAKELVFSKVSGFINFNKWNDDEIYITLS